MLDFSFTSFVRFVGFCKRRGTFVWEFLLPYLVTRTQLCALKCLGKVKFCRKTSFFLHCSGKFDKFGMLFPPFHTESSLLIVRRNLTKYVIITQINECLVTWLRMNIIIRVNKSVVIVKCARLIALSQNVVPPPLKVSINQYASWGSNVNN